VDLIVQQRSFADMYQLIMSAMKCPCSKMLEELTEKLTKKITEKVMWDISRKMKHGMDKSVDMTALDDHGR